MTAKSAVEQKFERTQPIFPNKPLPSPKVKLPDAITLTQPRPVVHQFPKMKAPKIDAQRRQQKEGQVAVPGMRMAKPQVITQPQTKAAMAAAILAEVSQDHPSTNGRRHRFFGLPSIRARPPDTASPLRFALL